MDNKISIVMPAYNAERFIKQSIQSILSQTYNNWELIIVDDYSTDNTVNIVRQYLTDSRIKLIQRTENSGGCRKPRFQAIEEAEGDYLCTIDADDVIEDCYLEKMTYKLNETGCDGVLGKLVFTDSELNKTGRILPIKAINTTSTISGKEACKKTIGEWEISVNGFLIPRAIYLQHINSIKDNCSYGPFSDELDARIVLYNMNSIAFCDAKYYYRQHGSSIVHTVSFNSYKALLANSELLDFVESMYSDDNSLIQKMHNDYIDKVYRYHVFYHTNMKEYSSEQQNYIKDLLRESYKTISKRKIKVTGMKRRLIKSHYSINILISFSAALFSKIK